MRDNAVTMFRWQLFLAAAGLAMMFPAVVWASPTPFPPSVPTHDTSIGTALCTAAGWMTGNLGVGLAVIGISILGILMLYGKIGWGLPLVAGTGVSIIFGAPVLLGTASCSGVYPGTNYAMGNTGLGSLFGVESSALLDLKDTGSLAPAAKGYPLIQFWGPETSNVYDSSGNLIYAAGEVGATTNLLAPINGWIQLEFTGLPPGWTVSPMYSWDGVGVNANGNQVVDAGLFTITGSNTYPGYIDTGVVLHQPDGTVATSIPAGASVKYNLFSDTTTYLTGCTSGACQVTQQYHFTGDTNSNNGYGNATYTSSQCTPASACSAPPL